jgi:hypothetical protein
MATSRAETHDRYERLVHRTGDLNHVLVRYMRAYLDDDGEALQECSTEAMAWLREHGQYFAATHMEIAGMASGLMSTGHLEELDAFVSSLADRYRAQGPPTQIDARQALQYMHEVLDELIEGYSVGTAHAPDTAVPLGKGMAWHVR